MGATLCVNPGGSTGCSAIISAAVSAAEANELTLPQVNIRSR
jgi:hypothetical protein